MNAIMDALAAHSTMSKQALESERVRDGLKDVLFCHPANAVHGNAGDFAHASTPNKSLVASACSSGGLSTVVVSISRHRDSQDHIAVALPRPVHGGGGEPDQTLAALVGCAANY
jgi:hypothetical protein